MPENKAKDPGGYAEHKELSADKEHLPFAVITVSDTRTEETDKSGRLIRDLLTEKGHRIARYRIVKDDPKEVRRELETCLSSPDIWILITNGGTGVARRDGTYEVVSSLLEKTLTGFGEIFRMLSYEDIGAGAIMSRATAGVARGKVVFAIPGSSGAVRLAMEKLILDEAGHIYWEITK
ncbi:MAG: molybdenum cofactor biosynthesis protein B [Nitrospinota bacterium]